MKKRIITIAITVVCAAGLAIGITSFTQGAGDDSSQSTGALASLANSYIKQTQRIIDNSNLSDEVAAGGVEGEDRAAKIDEVTKYHIVQITDTMGGKERQLYTYIQSDAFRTNIIGSEMKSGKFDLVTYTSDGKKKLDNEGKESSTSPEELASAIKGADLIYINVNESFEGHNLPATAVSAFAAYEGDKKPVIFDKGITGDKTTSVDDKDYKQPTNIYNYAVRVSSQAGTINDNGTSSIKGSDESWDKFLDMKEDTTYVDFDNSGTAEEGEGKPWNDYDQINVLEVVPSSDTRDKTSFYDNEIKPVTASDGTLVSGFRNALSDPTKNQDLSKGYRRMTVKELNDAVASANSNIEKIHAKDPNADTASLDALYNFQFIYFSHDVDKTDINYNDSATDLTDATVESLRNFLSRKSEDVAKADNRTIDDSEKGQYVNRLIFDERYISLYKDDYASESASSNRGGTGSTTIYSNNVFEIYETYSSMKNSEIVENGFFDSIKTEGEKRITDLINRSTYRTWSANGNGSTFKVLEIEPYYNVPESHQKWLQNNGSQLTDYLADGSNFENRYVSTNQDNIEKPYYEFVMTQARIAAATGLDPNQISVTCMSANQIGSTSVNILEDYDLVYIGDMHKNVKKKTDWNSYKDSKLVFSPKLSGLIESDNNWFQNNKSSDDLYNAFAYPGYSHTGEFVRSSDQNFTNIFAIGTNKNQAIRTNGSDITSKVAAQLYEYARSGMPLIIGADVLNSDYKIGGASVNAKLTQSDAIHFKYSSGSTTVDKSGYVIDMSDNSNAGYMKGSVSEVHVNQLQAGSDAEYDNGNGRKKYHVLEVNQDTSNPNNYNVTLQRIDNGETVQLNNKDQNTSFYNVSVNYASVTNTDQARKESDIDPSSYMYQLMYMIAEDPGSGIYHDSHPNIMVGFGTGDGKTAYDPDKAQLLNNHYNKGKTGDDDDPMEDGTDKLVSNIGDNAQFPVFNKTTSKELRQFLNKNVVVRPAINMVSAPVDYDSDRDMDVKTRKTNSKNPTFTFSISGKPGTYTVDLFYDLNGDGNFTNSKVAGRIKGSSYDTERVMESMSYTIPSSQTGSIITINRDTSGVDTKTFVVDKDFVGVLPYKLVVTDSTGKVTSVTGYPKYYAENSKSKLRILEIIPGRADGNVGAINSDVSTLCVKEPTLSNGKNIRDHTGECEFGINSADDRTKNLASALTSGDAEYDIHLTLMTTRIMDELAKRWLVNYAQNWDQNKSDPELDDSDREAFETKFLAKYFNKKEGKLTSEFENMISSDVKQVYDFGDKFGLTDNILANWLYSGDETKKETIDGGGNRKLDYDLGGYNMIVIGFSQQMGGKSGSIVADGDICNLTANCISAYISKNGSVLMGNDTTSYRPMTAGDVGWSKNINEYLRADFGMDRFKFNPEYGEDSSINNENKAGSNARSSFTLNYYKYTPYVNGSDGPGEFLTLNSYDGTYYGWKDNQEAIYGAGGTDAFTYAVGDGKDTIFSTNGVQVGVNKTRENPGPTTRAVRSNTGLLTKYPFTLGAFPSISRTASQYFALDTEDDYLNVWYTLASDGNQDNSLYAADPYNGRSHYYLYTYKSVTYTGAGYSDFNSTSDNEDERRLIINAIINKSNLSKNGLSVEFSKYASNGADDKSFEKIDEDKAGTFADGSPYSVLSINDADKDYVNFNIKYSIVKERTLKSVRLFIDNNHNGKKDGDDADIQGEYDLFKDMNNNVSFHIRGSKLDDAVTKAAQKGTFYICLSVSDDKQTEYKILKVKVNKKTELFNLN